MTIRDGIERAVGRLRADDLHAIVNVRESALEDARAADDAVAGGARPRALEGLAYTAKAVLAVAGNETTAACRALLGNVPDDDAAAIGRMRRAGAILVGQTNCSELALSPWTGNPLYPETRHPRLPGRSPGGSSGGCAAAVAAGLVAVSLGTDYGGSVRFPAACCDVVGLRPSPGRIPATGQVPVPPPSSPRARFSLVGTITADTDLLAAAFAALAEADAPKPHLPARVAVLDGPSARSRVTDAFARLGARTTLVRPPWFEEAADVFSAIRSLDDYADLRPLSDLLGPDLRALISAAPRAPDPQDRARLDARADELRREAAGLFDTFDLLVASVTTGPLPPLDGAPAAFDDLRPCRAVTLLDLPAVAIGGVQLIGPRDHDEDVIAAAMALSPHLA